MVDDEVVGVAEGAETAGRKIELAAEVLPSPRGPVLRKISWVGLEQIPSCHLAPLPHPLAGKAQAQSLQVERDALGPSDHPRVESLMGFRSMVGLPLVIAKPLVRTQPQSERSAKQLAD
eukprot:2335688-Pleurochrysis_carterae.AAC.1